MSDILAIDPIELLSELVGIPSVNPKSGHAGPARMGEARMAQFVASLLAAHGFDVTTQEVFPGRPNVVATLPGEQPGTIALCGHLDTVPVDGMTIEPYSGVVSDGRVWGRGAADMKAGIAAAICAAVAEADRQGRPGIMIVLTCDEEGDMMGARHFAESCGHDIRLMVICEPTCNALATAHKGMLRCEIRTSGKAAHASMPEKGVNAIYRMGPVLERLEKLGRQLLERPPHPQLGAPRLSVGIIAGGTAVNTVPDECMIKLDRRLIPGETEESAMAEVDALLDNLPGVVREPCCMCARALDTPEDDPWVQALCAAIDGVARTALPYATDGSILQEGGFPCVVLGPGEPSAAHTVDESVEITQVLDAVTLYRKILRCSQM